MTRPHSLVRPGAVVLAAMIACSASLASRAHADPADSAAAPASDAPVAPFAVVHPSYVPSPSAVDNQPAADVSDVFPSPPRIRSRARAAVAQPVQRARHAPVRPESPQAGMASTGEAATAAPPPATTAQAVAPLPVSPARTAPAPAVMSRPDVAIARPLAAGAGAGILLVAACFALWLRRRRKARFVGTVAKTPSWLSVMPSDLDQAPGEPASPTAAAAPGPGKSPGKRVTHGRSLDRSDEPGEQPHATPAARRGVASAERLSPL